MKKSITYLLILLYFTSFGQGKIDTIDSRCNTVIAIKGLNIRLKPDKNAKIIGKIPFGAQIKYLSNNSFGCDTISDYKSLNNRFLDTDRAYEFYGNWAKINYKGITGFVLDCYLFYSIVDEIERKKNDSFALLYPYSACYTNIYLPNKFNWYGMYRDKEGNYTLKKINISYFSVYNENFGGKDFGVSADDNNGLIVIIGSKDILSEGKRDCIDLITLKYGENRKYNESDMKLYGIEKIQINESGRDDYYVVKSGSKTQKLIVKINDEIDHYSFNEIKFIGDIDGDNKLDYILSFDGDVGYDVLFLSSKRKESKIVEPVAYFYGHYCC